MLQLRRCWCNGRALIRPKLHGNSTKILSLNSLISILEDKDVVNEGIWTELASRFGRCNRMKMFQRQSPLMMDLLSLLMDLEEVILEEVLHPILALDLVADRISVINVGHTIDRCWCLHGCPPKREGYADSRQRVVAITSSSDPNATSSSAVNPPLISQEQYAKLMSLLSERTSTNLDVKVTFTPTSCYIRGLLMKMPQLIDKEIKGLYIIDMNLFTQDVVCHVLSS
ncbi:LOW QUALITY PROTEIN: hypothetical protein V2J09_021942 [Rumex salicifolius]